MPSKQSRLQPATLAIHGGRPVLTTKSAPLLTRWGEPERRQLAKMIDQSSLFYWNGPQTALLVERFRKQYPFRHVMPCSSGTAALHIAVAAAGIGPGDEVITAPITDMGTVIGILYQQGVPVFADLAPHSYNLDPADVRRKITSRTRAIIAVHLAGNPCDLQALKAIADKHQLILIEDCAQAWGARYRGRPIGSVGQLACYSLNDFKHIGCGDGGIVAANDPRFGPLLQKFGDKAYDRTSVTRLPEFLAPNYRISEPQSAVAAVQLTRLPAIVAKRARLGRLLTRRLAGVGGIHPPRVDGADLCSFWFYMLRLDLRRLGCDRKEFVAALNAEGVPARAGYIDAPLYQYPVFQNCNFFAGRWPLREAGLTSMDYRKVACPVAEEILASSVIFPLNQAMDAAYITGVAAALRKVAQYFSNRSNISAKAGQV